MKNWESEVICERRTKVMNLLSKSPNGLRKREISSYTGIWVGDLVRVMDELEKDGCIIHTVYRDIANMERYDIYKIKA